MPPTASWEWITLISLVFIIFLSFKISFISSAYLLGIYSKLKLDNEKFPELTTGADIISTRILYAAGYNVPKNKIIYFDPSILKLSKKAFAIGTYGKILSLTQKEVKQETSENKKGRPESPVCLFVSIHKNIKKLYAFFIVLKTEIYLEIRIPLVRIFVAS